MDSSKKIGAGHGQHGDDGVVVVHDACVVMHHFGTSLREMSNSGMFLANNDFLNRPSFSFSNNHIRKRTSNSVRLVMSLVRYVTFQNLHVSNYCL